MLNGNLIQRVSMLRGEAARVQLQIADHAGERASEGKLRTMEARHKEGQARLRGELVKGIIGCVLAVASVVAGFFTMGASQAAVLWVQMGDKIATSASQAAAGHVFGQAAANCAQDAADWEFHGEGAAQRSKRSEEAARESGDKLRSERESLLRLEERLIDASAWRGAA